MLTSTYYRLVNGSAKCIDIIGPKYSLHILSPENDDFNDPNKLYCICRKPYDPYDDSLEKKMFRCDGPCQKWVHPVCFGDTLE